MPTDLRPLFNPSSVALVGASDRPGSLGRRVVQNLTEYSDFPGKLFYVNQSKTTLFDRPCYPRVSAVPEPVELAIIVIPAAGVLDALRDCVESGVRFVMVFTSGFGEAGEEGRRQQEEMARIARRSGMRIVGPNCPGFTNMHDRIGLTFSPAFRMDRVVGPIGLATQGGGLGRSVLNAGVRGVGTALWASLGNAVDVDVPEVLEYYTRDERISVLATVLEGIADGRAFLSAARAAAAADKPMVALKIGRSEYGARAVASHTASMTGSAQVNSAVFDQFGVVDVDDINELIDIAWLLVRGRPPAEVRVGVWGVSGGALSLCADIVGQAGLTLATFADATRHRLAGVLPAYAGFANPVDATAAVLYDPELVYQSLLAVAEDPGVDVVLFPQVQDYGDDFIPVMDAVTRVQAQVSVPVLSVWASDSRGPGFRILADAGLAPPASISYAVKAITRWARYGAWRAANREHPVPTPLALERPSDEDLDLAHRTLAERTATEPAAKAWLGEYGVPVPRGLVARTEDDARAAAETLQGPLVVKIVSPDITHKSDIGGVEVGLTDVEEVLAARAQILESAQTHRPDARIDGVLVEEMVRDGRIELIVGVHRDPTFGQVLTVGSGGVWVEVMSDTQLRLLPVDRRLAREMVDQLRIRPILDGLRGASPLDVDAVVDLLVAVSDLATANPSISEFDLNPVVVRPRSGTGPGVVVLDALVVSEPPTADRA